MLRSSICVQRDSPSSPAARQQSDGLTQSPCRVVTSSKSISSGETPAFSSAARPAAAVRPSSVSCVSTRRSRMPVRVEIHSSLVSIIVESSSFVTVRSGTARPVPVMIKLIFLISVPPAVRYFRGVSSFFR